MAARKKNRTEDTWENVLAIDKKKKRNRQQDVQKFGHKVVLEEDVLYIDTVVHISRSPFFFFFWWGAGMDVFSFFVHTWWLFSSKIVFLLTQFPCQRKSTQSYFMADSLMTMWINPETACVCIGDCVRACVCWVCVLTHCRVEAKVEVEKKPNPTWFITCFALSDFQEILTQVHVQICLSEEGVAELISKLST